MPEALSPQVLMVSVVPTVVLNILQPENGRNTAVVCDEDQSIYGFRAAYPEALLSFEKNHKGAKVLLMEDNYRSNANIAAAAAQCHKL